MSWYSGIIGDDDSDDPAPIVIVQEVVQDYQIVGNKAAPRVGLEGPRPNDIRSSASIEFEQLGMPGAAGRRAALSHYLGG